MRDIDLIPPDYLRARAARRSLAVAAAAIALVLLASAGGRGWLALRLSAARSAAVEARREDSAAAAQQARLAQLQAAVDAAEARLAALRRLVDGGTGDGWWEQLDAAYNDRIWLDAVAYARRPGEAAPVPAAGAAAPGGAAAVVASEHRLELRGHALDHGAAAEFRRALADQPGVAAVKLGDTALQPFAGRDVVAFTITVQLADGAGAPMPTAGAAVTTVHTPPAPGAAP